jgi:hypothetical protein
MRFRNRRLCVMAVSMAQGSAPEASDATNSSEWDSAGEGFDVEEEADAIDKIYNALVEDDDSLVDGDAAFTLPKLPEQNLAADNEYMAALAEVRQVRTRCREAMLPTTFGVRLPFLLTWFASCVAEYEQLRESRPGAWKVLMTWFEEDTSSGAAHSVMITTEERSA